MYGIPMLTTNYRMSNVTAFTLYDFYFGCTSNLMNGAAELNEPCSLTVTCYNGSDNTVADSREIDAQTVQFNPTTQTGPQQMAHFVIRPSLGGASFCTFGFLINNMPLLQTDLAGLIDTVKYTAYTCSGKST